MRYRGAGTLRDLVAFDRKVTLPDGKGGSEDGWAEQFRRKAEFIYERGNEVVATARLTGRAIYKLRVRSSRDTREITPDWRMRDLRRDVTYAIREADAVTDRQWVYLVVESGAAA